MTPVLKSQEPSESLGFVHTDRFPNGSGSDRSPVHTETAIRTSIRSSKGPGVGPAKMQEQFRSHIGQVLCEHLVRFVLVPRA